MAQTKLENHLSRVSLIRRLVWISLAILDLATAVLTHISKVDPETHRFASQADSSTFFFSIVMSVVFLFLLVYDLVWCKYRVFLREGHLVTVFRGFFKRIVYVDGKERGRLSVTTVNFLDVWLNRSLRMTIVFSNAFWHLCHITYSDGSPTELI